MGRFTYQSVTVAEEGHTLSKVIWQRFHRPMPGVAEEALAVNRGLADLGAHIPAGTEVIIPVPVAAEREEPEAIRLW